MRLFDLIELRCGHMNWTEGTVMGWSLRATLLMLGFVAANLPLGFSHLRVKLE